MESTACPFPTVSVEAESALSAGLVAVAQKSVTESDFPSSRANSPRTSASLSAPGVGMTAPKLRSRPSQLRKVPAFSVTTATGRTTSASAVTSVWRVSSETTNCAFSIAAIRSPSTSSGETPPTTSPLIADPVAATISEVLRPSIGSKPASSAPRSPARRGIQANFAPVLETSSATAVSAPGVWAARSPTKITLSPER